MKCCIIPIIEINTLKRHGNVKILSHNHNQYLLLYKAAEHLASGFGQILRVPEVEYISYNTGTRALPDIYALALGRCAPSGIVRIYQAKHSCLCYNYYL